MCDILSKIFGCKILTFPVILLRLNNLFLFLNQNVRKYLMKLFSHV